MGEIAEAMISGKLCAQCGCDLFEAVVKMDMGIPIYCDFCWGELPAEDKKYFTKESQLIN